MSGNPVQLCRYQLPTGKTCRQITLKGEPLCRHHRRVFHKSEAEMAHEEAMERLAGHLNSLPTIELFRALTAKLRLVRTAVRSCPEAQIALEVALVRLEQMRQDSEAPMNFAENPAESMIFEMPDFLKTQQNQ